MALSARFAHAVLPSVEARRLRVPPYLEALKGHPDTNFKLENDFILLLVLLLVLVDSNRTKQSKMRLVFESDSENRSTCTSY